MEEIRDTYEEEYKLIRKKHIVDSLYGGDDNLPLEIKEEILSRTFEENASRSNTHCTRLNERGENVWDGHVRFYTEVAMLEHEYLLRRQLIIPCLS